MWTKRPLVKFEKPPVSEGTGVDPDDLVLVLEAMKMEQPVADHKPGVVTNLSAQGAAASPAGPTGRMRLT